jgi:multidrug efflux pump
VVGTNPARNGGEQTTFESGVGNAHPVLSHGAGAEVRAATGIDVFAGMIGVTLFGLFLTPVFYVDLRKLSGLRLVQHGEANLAHG